MGDEAEVQLKPSAIPDSFWRSLGPRGRWEILSLDNAFGLVVPHGSRLYGGEDSNSDWNILVRGAETDLRFFNDSRWAYDGEASRKSPIVKIVKNIDGRKITVHLCLSDWSFSAMCDARDLIMSMEAESGEHMAKSYRCHITSKLLWAGLNKHRSNRGQKGYGDDGRLNYPYCFTNVMSTAEKRHAENVAKTIEKRLVEKKQAYREASLDDVMKKALAATAKYDYI